MRAVGGKLGRPNKYPINLLNINEAMTLPYEDINILSCKQAIARYADRHNKQFDIVSGVAGLTVTRKL